MTRAGLVRRLRAVLEIGCPPTDSDQGKVTKEVLAAATSVGTRGSHVTSEPTHIDVSDPWQTAQFRLVRR